MALALAWFGLAYWQRRFALWEPVLVVLGGAAALARVGNLWVDAVLMLLPRLCELGPALVGDLPSQGVPTLDEPLRRETVELLRADASLVLDGHRSDRSIGASDRSGQPYRVRAPGCRAGPASSGRPGPPS